MQPWAPKTIPAQLDGETLSDYLAMWTRINVRYLLTHPNTPSIYSAGVRYIPEPPNQEVWRAIPHVIANGGSVCHSLACWRAAELQVKGEPAVAKWSVVRLDNGSDLWHVRVFRGPNTRSAAYPDGRIEDPSAMLGMGKSAPEIALMGPTHHVQSVAGMVWR